MAQGSQSPPHRGRASVLGNNRAEGKPPLTVEGLVEMLRE